MKTATGKDLEPATAKKYGKLPIYHHVIFRFPRALREVAKVSEMGNRRHGRPDDLESVDTIFTVPHAEWVYKNAMMRHIVDRAIEGEVNEQDEGVLHAAQIAWNAMCDLEVMLRQAEEKPAPIPAPVTKDDDVIIVEPTPEQIEELEEAKKGLNYTPDGVPYALADYPLTGGGL